MHKPEEILQKLIRFNTVNPPGNEEDCIGYLKDLLDEAGLETKIIAKVPGRPNLFVRLAGAESPALPPVLLYGHVDTVPVTGQAWSVDPFEGLIKDGCLWGRGVLDMKGFLVMYISAALRLKAEGAVLPFDVLMLFLCDEEDKGEFGAKYICGSEHKDLLKDVKYAICELGGFSMFLCGKKFYPIMVSEKQCAHLKITFRGKGGHGSTLHRDSSVAKMGRALVLLNEKRLPLHVSEEARGMINAIAANIGLKGLILRLALNPLFSGKILDLIGADGEYFDVILHNTVNATIVKNQNDSINVIPEEVSVELDTRLIPRQKIEDVIRELQNLLGGDCSIEAVNYDPGPDTVDFSLFENFAGVLKKCDPDAIPIPYIMSGVTDGRFFAKLGIQTYGFTPMNLPKDFPLLELIHGADERIPLDALNFGANAVYELLKSIK